MTVLLFPTRSSLALVSKEQARPPLTLEALVEMGFPACAQEDAESGLLGLSPEGAAELDAFYRAFGLRLPAVAHAQAAHQLWAELRFRYGRIVRVVLDGGDPAERCEEFTAQELEYGRAVTQQNVAAAARLARPLFAPKGFAAFVL